METAREQLPLLLAGLAASSGGRLLVSMAGALHVFRLLVVLVVQLQLSPQLLLFGFLDQIFFLFDSLLLLLLHLLETLADPFGQLLAFGRVEDAIRLVGRARFLVKLVRYQRVQLVVVGRLIERHLIDRRPALVVLLMIRLMIRFTIIATILLVSIRLLGLRLPGRLVTVRRLIVRLLLELRIRSSISIILVLLLEVVIERLVSIQMIELVVVVQLVIAVVLE